MAIRTRSPKLLPALLGVSVLLGCHHAGVAKTGASQEAARGVTPEGLFEVGLLHARRGDSLRAEQYLSAARFQGYDEAATVYWLVRVCLAAGRYQSALRHAADYLREHPGHWVLRLVVATIYEALGKLGRARVELERVVESKPLEPLGHYRLAMLYQRLQPPGFARAMHHLEVYLELAPDGAHAEEAKDALRLAGTMRAENARVIVSPGDQIRKLP